MNQESINGEKYELITNFKDGYDQQETESKLTDYFIPYDYIVGDWAYGKLRLKGFYDAKNKSASAINNYKNVELYIKQSCAYNCRYFILKKKVN